MTGLQIGKAIFQILNSNSGLTASVGTNIFPLIATQDVTFPFIIYKRTAFVPSYTKDKYSVTDSVSIQIVIASEKYSESCEIADLINTQIVGISGYFSGLFIDNIQLTDADEDYQQDTYIQTLTYQINLNNTK